MGRDAAVVPSPVEKRAAKDSPPHDSSTSDPLPFGHALRSGHERRRRRKKKKKKKKGTKKGHAPDGTTP